MIPPASNRSTANPVEPRWTDRSALFVGHIVVRGALVGVVCAGAAAVGLLKIVPSPKLASPGAIPADTVSTSLRPVRVLISSGRTRVRFRSDAPIRMRGADTDQAIVLPGTTWIECVVNRGEIVCNGDKRLGHALLVDAPSTSPVSVAFYREGTWSEPRAYPGTLRCVVSEDGTLDVVNAVDIEPYVACVTANEVWPGFHQETFFAQAIVARTYVLYQMKRRNSESFDVSATQGSQVYRGVRRDTTGVQAANAAARTRGIVLTWFDGTADRVFCAYYSAACGGHTQSAAIFGSESDIEPLSGGVACDYCRIAPGETYRWGPVRLSLTDLYRRLVARYADLSSLGRLKLVEVTQVSRYGRAVTVRLTGSRGRSKELMAERFRLAVGASELRSTHFRVRREGQTIVFEDGRGFGHGLGLCQWGAEGQARLGRRAGAILRFYYPGAKLTRAY